jgi:hypothetical protein
MKCFSVVTLIFCTGTFCLAQDQLEVKVFGSPTFSYRMITGDNEFHQLLNDVHDPMLRYDGGVLITVAKRSRMDFETGLVLSRKGLSFGEISFRDVNNDPMGSVEINLTADFVEVPFRLNYYFSEAQKNYLVAGLSADFLIRSRYHYKIHGDTPDMEQEQPTGMRKFNTSLQLGYGYRLVHSEGFGLDLEPNFKIQLLDASTETSSITLRYYSIGLGCKFRFKV